MSMLTCTNAYEFPNVRVRGYACKTNLGTNTAMRGLGAIQSLFICESAVDHMADELKMDQSNVCVQ
jgi:CO/xanthine dehydrogenase Mo-binding subunit